MVGAFLLKANVAVQCSHVLSVSSHEHSSSQVRVHGVRSPRRDPHHWDCMQAEIETHLRNSIPKKEPMVVFEPMHHLALSAPETTVPILCLSACQLVAGCRQQAMAAASALLLLHAATHIHQHLPLTDRPKPKPRPKPKYSPNIELLTGDGIPALAFELLARPGSDDDEEGSSERILRVMVEIARAMGSEGLIDAQYKMAAMEDGGDGDGDGDDELERMQQQIVEKKEGGLHACGAACGAMLGGACEEEIERLRKYGFYVGVIRGMLQRGFMEDHHLLQENRKLALKELQVFKDRDVAPISAFLY